MDLMSFSPRRFIFMLINSGMSQWRRYFWKVMIFRACSYDSYPLKVYSIECLKLRIKQGGKCSTQNVKYETIFVEIHPETLQFYLRDIGEPQKIINIICELITSIFWSKAKISSKLLNIWNLITRALVQLQAEILWLIWQRKRKAAALVYITNSPSLPLHFVSAYELPHLSVFCYVKNVMHITHKLICHSHWSKTLHYVQR